MAGVQGVEEGQRGRQGPDPRDPTGGQHRSGPPASLEESPTVALRGWVVL